MGLLTLQDVKLTLNETQVLKGVSMDIWEGHVHAVVGPNGAGKSTLASVIMGLSGYTDIAGDIVFQGSSIRNKPVWERAQAGITLGWQEPARFEGISIKTFLYLSAAHENKSDEAVADTLSRVGLDPEAYMTRIADKSLSGGERKKLELASILIMNPRLVILDEPDSGIDVESLNRIFDAVALFKKNGTTTILITHSATVLHHAEHAFLMCNGKIIDKGVTKKIEPYFENNCLPCEHPNAPITNESDRN
jgi:Fe-S cluster assembly ATP-binding protein